jgi:hypothetical protein
MKILNYRSKKFKEWITGMVFALILFFGTGLIFANETNNGTGSIEGTVKDKKTGETLIGANVIIEGTLTGTTTDFQGHFEIQNLKPGKYNLKVSYVSYNPVIYEGIVVEPVKTTTVEVEIEEIAVDINEVTVLAVRKTNTDISMISAIKASAIVTTGITGQQISRTLDRDASEVVKRVPGITIYDDKFIIVRGLNQRYNNVWLNSSSVPSFEADSRAFSFDVIPSAVIDNLTIIKSPSPDIPADFAGGFVKITTKNMPDKDFLDLQYSTSYNQGTTFVTFYHQEHSSTDWLGYDDGMRSLPKDFPSKITNFITNAERERLGRQINPKWDPIKTTAIPDQRLSVTFGKRFQLKSTGLGNITSISYSNTFDFNEFIKRDYQSYDSYKGLSDYNYDFKEKYYTNSVKLSLLHNWSYFFKNGKIEFRSLLNQLGKFKTSFREGQEYYNLTTIREQENQFQSRFITSNQLGGEFIKNNTKLDWVVGYSLSNRNEPALSRIRSTFVADTVSPYNWVNAIQGQVSPQYGGLIYTELSENTYSTAINYQIGFPSLTLKPHLKTGVFTEWKDRDFSVRNMGYRRSLGFNNNLQYIRPYNELFTDENINSTDGVEIDEVTRLTDSYKGYNNLMAGYISAQLSYKRFNALIGSRVEYNNQNIKSYNVAGEPISVNIEKVDLFPSVNLYYNFNDQNIMRLAYGRSVNRPEFREVAPFGFYVFEKFASVIGNDTLKNSYINNFDLRYELYPSQGETFSIAVFYKKFINPIEAKRENGDIYTYQNAHLAHNFGMEVDIRKSLDFFFNAEKWSIVANGAIINSRVEFTANQHTRNRPLQGQSPYIVNLGLFYQNQDNGLMLSFLYNIIGKRIATVGLVKDEELKDIPDVYEMPRNVVDFTFSKKFGKLVELKGGVKDILSEEAYSIQTVKNDNGEKIVDNLTSSYYPGRSVNLGFILHF